MTTLVLEVYVPKHSLNAFAKELYTSGNALGIDMDGVQISGLSEDETLYISLTPESFTDAFSDLLGTLAGKYDAQINDKIREL